MSMNLSTRVSLFGVFSIYLYFFYPQLSNPSALFPRAIRIPVENSFHLLSCSCRYPSDRQVHTRHTTAVERSPTRRGIQRARWASCRRCWNPEARPQASATRAVVSDVPASLIGTVERKWRYPVSAIRVPRTGFHDAP